MKPLCFVVARRTKANGDDWEYDTLPEPAVLTRDVDEATESAATARAAARLAWKLESTADPLERIACPRSQEKKDVSRIGELVAHLRSLACTKTEQDKATNAG